MVVKYASCRIGIIIEFLSDNLKICRAKVYIQTSVGKACEDRSIEAKFSGYLNVVILDNEQNRQPRLEKPRERAESKGLSGRWRWRRPGLGKLRFQAGMALTVAELCPLRQQVGHIAPPLWSYVFSSQFRSKRILSSESPQTPTVVV